MIPTLVLQILHVLALFTFALSQCDTSEKDLNTNLKGDTGSFGNMFELVAKGSDVRITGMDIYTDIMTNVTFHLWSKKDTYVGYENNPSAWTKETTGWTYGAGVGRTTPIPDRFFPTFEIEANTRRSFVISLEEPDLRYDVGPSDEGEAWEESEHLKLTQGKGVAQFPPFERQGTFYAPRVFNGKISYVSLAGCAENEDQSGNQNNAVGGGRGGRGGNVNTNLSPSSTSITDLMYKFTIDTQDATSDVEKDVEKFVLTTLDKGIADSSGYGKKHKELIDSSQMTMSDVVVTMYPGSVSISDACSMSSYSNSCQTIDIIASVEHSENTSSEEIRYFLLLHAGLIENMLRSAYSFVEYHGPQAAETKKVVTLEGVSLDSFTDESTIAFFENTMKTFLDKDLSSNAEIARVKITSRSSRNGLNGRTYGEDTYNKSIGGGGRYRRHLEDVAGGKYNDSSGRIRKHSFESVDLGVEITGEYQPPPDIDFAEKTQDSFDNDAGTLIEMLQDDPRGNFEGLASIASVTEDSNQVMEPNERSFSPPEDTIPNTDDDRGDMESAGATAGKNIWNRPEAIAIYVIGAIVVGTLVFTVWRRAVRGEGDHHGADLRNFTGSLFSGFKEDSRKNVGSRRFSSTAPPDNVIVVDGDGGGMGRASRHSMFVRPTNENHMMRSQSRMYGNRSNSAVGGINLAQSSRWN